MKRFLLPLLLLSLLLSCTKESGVGVEGEKKEVGIYPDVILENAEYHIGEDGSDPIVMNAGRITFYSIDGYALVDGMEFHTMGEEGETLVSGKAGQGRIDTEGDELELWDGVEFSDERNGMKIIASSILYNRSEDTLVANGSVVVESKEGFFQGSNFRGDLRTGTYTFETIEKGELKLE